MEETGEFSLDPGGLDVSTGRDNLVVRAFESLHPADGIAFRLRSEIPLARGLGSSAAAIVAGLFAADHLFELALTKEEMLARATELEGHPDNVAAAIYGGFVVCGARADGAPLAARFDPPEGLEGIVVIPPEEVSTKLAREAIPAEVPLADAVANVSAAALLVLGLRSADLDLVAARPRRRASTSRAAASSTRARWRSSTRPPSWARWGRRSPAPARPSWSGPPGRTPARSPPRWSSAAPAGPRSAACPSRPTAPTSPSSEMDWVVQIGLVELALGGLLGWAMVIRQDRPRVADPDRHRRPAADPPGPPRLRDDGPDPDRGRPRGPGPADRDRRRARLRHRSSIPSSSSRSPSTRTREAALVPGCWRRLLHRRQRRPRRRGDRRPRCTAAVRPRRRDADGAARIAAMPSLPKFKLLGALVAATALLALPAAAQATLVYVKNPMKPAVFAANDNGGGALKVGPGTNPRVSPDGDGSPTAHEGPAASRN